MSAKALTTFLLVFAFNGCCSAQQVPTYSGDISTRQHIPFFIVVEDTQRTSFWEIWREQNDEARIAVLCKIASEEPAFVIHLGDLVFQGSSPRHWQRFDEYAADIRRKKIPVFPILGNHEYYGSMALFVAIGLSTMSNQTIKLP
jgi:hypothetical protein